MQNRYIWILLPNDCILMVFIGLLSVLFASVSNPSSLNSRLVFSNMSKGKSNAMWPFRTSPSD